MTLNLMPSLRGTGRRRAVDEVGRLREREQHLETALAAAGDEVALLRWDLTVANLRVDERDELVVKQQADIDDLTAERDALLAEVGRFRDRFGAQLAAEANANAITVPPMVRDTSDPADQATAPIDVRPLWDALGVGPTTAVTDPGHAGT